MAQLDMPTYYGVQDGVTFPLDPVLAAAMEQDRWDVQRRVLEAFGGRMITGVDMEAIHAFFESHGFETLPLVVIEHGNQSDLELLRQIIRSAHFPVRDEIEYFDPTGASYSGCSNYYGHVVVEDVLPKLLEYGEAFAFDFMTDLYVHELAHSVQGLGVRRVEVELGPDQHPAGQVKMVSGFDNCLLGNYAAHTLGSYIARLSGMWDEGYAATMSGRFNLGTHSSGLDWAATEEVLMEEDREVRALPIPLITYYEQPDGEQWHSEVCSAPAGAAVVFWDQVLPGLRLLMDSVARGEKPIEHFIAWVNERVPGLYERLRDATTWESWMREYTAAHQAWIDTTAAV